MNRVCVIVLLVCAAIAACDSHKDVAQLASVQPPRFKDTDLNWPKVMPVKYECDMTAESTSGRLMFQGDPPVGLLPGFMIIRQKPSMPRFYKGRSLHYILTETPGRGYLYGGGLPLSLEFPQFTTEFVIAEKVIVGARTKSKDGELRAEATVRYFPRTGGIQIQEYHYDHQGMLVFTCVSDIDPHSGFKTAEHGALGKKRGEYYFLWRSD